MKKIEEGGVFNSQYYEYLKVTMQAVRSVLLGATKPMTVGDINEQLPYLDSETIREALDFLRMDYEVQEVYISVKTTNPESYGQTVRNGTFSDTRRTSPLRETYESERLQIEEDQWWRKPNA